MKNADANVVQTVDNMMKLLPEFERWVPPAIKMHVLYDRTLLIRASIADVQFTIAMAIVLVVSGGGAVLAALLGDGHSECHHTCIARRSPWA